MIIDFNGTYENLVNLIKDSGKPAVVIFFKPSSPSLNRFFFEIEKDVQRNPNVIFIKVNVGKNQKLLKRITINSSLVIKFFKFINNDFTETGQVLGANVPSVKLHIENLQKYYYYLN